MKRKLKLLLPLIIVICVVLSLLAIFAALLVVNAFQQGAMSGLQGRAKWVSFPCLVHFGSGIQSIGSGLG